MNTCIKCGGTMIGDGYTSVVHCEFADNDELAYMAPDEAVVYCDYEDESCSE